jgi:Ala-tRNA(Pro) deacylase|tara:strand:- start:298 stop:804 length:507 start_codon:yes stop_codon:yes gene_type:complete
MNLLFDKLSQLNINYKLFEHKAFFTVKESSKLKNELNLEGAHTKNLFLRDKKRKIFLISCADNTDVDLKILKNIIPAQGNLSFGSPELLNDKLKVKPGSVSPYALINNLEKDVNFYIDKNILNEKLCNFHPLLNTKTIQLETKDFIRFIREFTYLNVIDFDNYEIINL